MIDSREHAVIDGVVAISLAGVALLPFASGSTRGTAAAASALLASLSAVTDYEGGVAPRVSLATHRAVEAASGTALCVAGLRRGGRGGAWALTMAGAVQLGLAAFASEHAHAGPPSMSYAPLDTPKPFGGGIWLVDSVIGPGVPVRMTVVRLGSGELLLHSPTQYGPALRASLEQLGPIRHLVAPNSVHWMFMKAWQEALPEATAWAAPGLRRRGQVRRSGLRIDHKLGDAAPAAWDGEIDQAIVRGGAGFAEVAMFHRPSRTLLMTDLMQSFEAGKLPWVLRPIGRLLGNVAPESRAPAHLRALVQAGGETGRVAAARRIVDWAPARVIVTHGLPIETDAAGTVRRSLAWLTG